MSKDHYRRASMTGLNHVKGQRIDTTYWVENYKYSSILDKDIFICHLIPSKPVKVSNYTEIFSAQEQAVRNILQQNKSVDRENSLIFTFFYLTQGIKFIPDLRFYENLLEIKKALDKKYDVNLSGVLTIVDEKHYKAFEKYKDKSPLVPQIANIDIVSTVEEAYRSLDEKSV